MASDADQLHIFFFPFMAHGHMMPFIDLAKLFAYRGVRATLLLTPVNAALFEDTVDRCAAAGHPIAIHILEFPAAQSGLAEGSENLDYITNPFDAIKLYKAIEMFEESFERLVEALRPDGVVSDMYLPWTADVARRFGIPRLLFSGGGFFPFCCLHSIRRFSPEKAVESDDEAFLLPELPHPIEMVKSQLPDLSKTPPEFAELWQKIGKAEPLNHGVVMNTFYELEPAYADYYRDKMGKRAWSAGPVSLCNREAADRADRGKKASIPVGDLLNWLESRAPDSVLYVCFGSRCKFEPPQLAEIAEALDSAGCPFIWVLKETQVLPEGFEERAGDKGLVIRGWAPQMVILDHPAVGGFLTHCGWNSLLEGVSAGRPMITWPAFAEQFYNEKLVTEVLNIGVAVGARQWLMWGEERRRVVGRAAVEAAVRRVMGGGEEGRRLRERTSRLGKMAKAAVEEGGSSWLDLGRLIEELTEMRAERVKR